MNVMGKKLATDEAISEGILLGIYAKNCILAPFPSTSYNNQASRDASKR
jgi:hypothetical protein